MNRKMTLLAFADFGGAFAASGFTSFGRDSSAAARLLKNPSADKRPASAKPVNFAPASHRNSRRVRPQKLRRTVTDFRSHSLTTHLRGAYQSKYTNSFR